jgi:hypothetical protein
MTDDNRKSRGKKAFDALAAQFSQERPESLHPKIPIEEEINEMLVNRGLSNEEANAVLTLFEEVCDNERISDDAIVPFSHKFLGFLVQPFQAKEAKSFVNVLVEWFDANQPAPKKGTDVLGQLTPQQSGELMKRLRQAASERDKFKPNEIGTVLVHQPPKTDLAVVLEPYVGPAKDFVLSLPEEIKELQKKFLSIGAHYPTAVNIAMGLAVEHETTDLDLDHFITAVGLEPENTEERVKHRRMLWESLQLLAQTSITGTITGRYRDKRGRPLTYVEKSPVIVLRKMVYAEGDKNPDGTVHKDKTPLRVMFSAGGFFAENRGDKKVLSSISDTRQLAGITPGKPSGQWAQSITMALNQHWRENAAYCEVARVGEDSHETVRMAKTTRRELFLIVRPDPNPFEILDSDVPGRARKYWDAAIEILREKKIAVLVGTSFVKLPRFGWREPWLDESLDIRPHPENGTTLENIKEISSGAATWRKKKGRRKTSGDRSSEEILQT